MISIVNPLFSRLHAFFGQITQQAGDACLLGGAVAPSSLNQWAIMGLNARQEIVLRGNILKIRSTAGTLSYDLSKDGEGLTAEARLFNLLKAARAEAIAWPEEKARWRLPMAGGLVGCFAYDFYRWCDTGWKNAAPSDDRPSLVLCEFEDWLLLHLESGRLIVLSADPQRKARYEALWKDFDIPADDFAEPLPEEPDGEALYDYLHTFERSFEHADFVDAVDRLKDHIAAGELYQANLSIRFQKRLALDPLKLFQDLCRRNPSPFSAFFRWADGMMICNSPERLLHLDETGRAQTRPIAGTRGRGRTDEEDMRIGEALLQNEKERAEHLMLVDLARNDLGRICRPGSVQVDELLVLERYSHVTHLVSNVTGQLAEEYTGWDLLRALFPCGTITGCPKIRCVNILHEIEPVPRGFYTGSMGYLDAASPAMDVNILIRSLFLQPELPSQQGETTFYQTTMHVGAGIVHDAVGDYEYRECLRKAAASLSALLHAERRETCISASPL